MFTVLSVQSKEEQERLSALCNTPYCPDCLAYALTVDGTFSGLCQFRLFSGGGEIVSVNTTSGFSGNEDGTAAQYLAALCRTVLSFMEQLGTPKALYRGAPHGPAVLYLCGFTKEEDGVPCADLTTLFKICPSSGKPH